MKKIFAVGCSHALAADPLAVRAVLSFRESFKPDTTLHLGDAVDVTALRSGAGGTADESKPLEPDVDGGIELLKALRPNVFMWGNHEDRLTRLRDHPNAIVSYAANQIANALNDCCKAIRCRVVPYTGIYQGVVYGGYRYMHGVLFNENSVRDHAETFGNCVFAHTHRAGMATGRRSDSPNGFCVGTLTRRENMDYAKTRRSTLGWSQGFVWGYYSDKWSQLWLHEQPHGAKIWQLPG